MALRTMGLSLLLPSEILMMAAPASTAATIPLAMSMVSDWPRSSAMRTERISAPGATPGVSVSLPIISDATAVPWPFQSAKLAGKGTRLSEVMALPNA